MSAKHFSVLILGAGTAGIIVAARLMRKKHFKSIAVIDPSDTHFYQPLFTLVGGGLVNREITHKPMKKVIPPGVEWIQESVQKIKPDQNNVETGQSVYTYDYLVVATGIKADWSFAEGLEAAIGTQSICSIYSYDTVNYCAELLPKLKSGNLIFTMHAGMLKCGGAPQKIMWLMEDYLTRMQLRKSFKVFFAKEGDGMFGIEKYKKQLDILAEQRAIQKFFHQKLIQVNAKNKKATFQNTQTKEITELEFELLHVVPHFKVDEFITRSPLANANGEVNVDAFTLQSPDFPNVFSLGDCSSCPTGKTGAAIRKEAPVVVQNLLAYDQGKPMKKKYNGYTACPILTRHNRVMLAEFGYDGVVMESFPFNQAQESYLMYLFKRYLLPFFYWKLMLRGLM